MPSRRQNIRNKGTASNAADIPNKASIEGLKVRKARYGPPGERKNMEILERIHANRKAGVDPVAESSNFLERRKKLIEEK